MVRSVMLLAFSLPILVSEDVLEPSVRNEVDHAISIAEESLSRQTNSIGRVQGDVFATNGLSATDMALKLVAKQSRDGRWVVGTNDFTKLAVDILKSL